MVYHKWKCIFIQIPKNASTSISNILHNDIDNFFTEHVWFFDILIEQDIKLCESYFSFAVVRNPYDRFVSQYEYGKTECNIINYTTPFDEFVDNVYKYGEKFYLEPMFKSPIWVPQYKYVTIKNIILVDDIIRFENIDEDWKKISDIINNNHKYKPISSNLEILNISETRQHNPWQDYYKNVETKEKVYQIFKNDFEIFGYDK